MTVSQGAKHLQRQVENHFFERRARRIIPAMNGMPNQPHDPLAEKHRAATDKLNRRRKTASEVSVQIIEERTSFFDKLAVLNAGALTFSVTLLNRTSPSHPHILYVLYAAWVWLLIALASCLVRNISHQGYRYSNAMAETQASEIEYIDVNSEILVTKADSIMYLDSAEPFDLEGEKKLAEENRKLWDGELLRTKTRLGRYWKTALVSEWVAGIGMFIGFLLLIIFAVLNTQSVVGK